MAVSTGWNSFGNTERKVLDIGGINLTPFELTFETKCYENDWEHLLKTERLKFAIEANQYPFTEKTLYINNVEDKKEVCHYAEKLINIGVLTSYVIVDEFVQDALDFFELAADDFNGGYYYSISELVGIYLCKTDYLLHYSSDSLLEQPFDWIDASLLKMNQHPVIKVANPTWNQLYMEAKDESLDEDENFYIGYGFSDQCYLIRTSDFRAPIFHEQNIASQRYPEYGGELFEKRVDAWMRNHQYQRITFKHGSYLHHNFP